MNFMMVWESKSIYQMTYTLFGKDYLQSILLIKAAVETLNFKWSKNGI